MALQAVPPISLSDVCTEFGVAANTPMASFLRGGGIVADSAANAGVPTALPISLLALLGASAAAPVNLADHSLYSVSSSGLASVSYQFNAAGTVQWTEAPSNSGFFSGEWLVSGTASAYEVRVSGTTATVLNGIADNVWQNAAATWSAYLGTDNQPGTIRREILTVELRPAGGGAVLSTALIDMNAERL